MNDQTQHHITRKSYKMGEKESYRRHFLSSIDLIGVRYNLFSPYQPHFRLKIGYSQRKSHNNFYFLNESICLIYAFQSIRSEFFDNQTVAMATLCLHSVVMATAGRKRSIYVAVYFFNSLWSDYIYSNI